MCICLQLDSNVSVPEEPASEHFYRIPQPTYFSPPLYTALTVRQAPIEVSTVSIPPVQEVQASASTGLPNGPKKTEMTSRF